MIKQGESLFIPFIKGAGVPDAHYKARTYKSVEACRKALKRDFDKVEIVEYAPVKRGEWVEHPWAEEVNEFLVSNFECSLCCTWERRESKYCPNCGAKMDGKEDGKDA